MCASHKPPDDDGHYGDDQQYHQGCYDSTHKCTGTWIPVRHGRPIPGSWSYGSISVAVTVIKIEVCMYVCMCNEYVCVDVHVYSEYKCGYEEGCGA